MFPYIVNSLLNIRSFTHETDTYIINIEEFSLDLYSHSVVCHFNCQQLYIKLHKYWPGDTDILFGHNSTQTAAV
jgi:hypothetical protein